MSEIKLLQFEPIGSFALGDKTMYFEDAPGGMSYSIEHLNPVSARRTQNGTLITQSIRYNKKNIPPKIDNHLAKFLWKIKTMATSSV